MCNQCSLCVFCFVPFPFQLNWRRLFHTYLTVLFWTQPVCVHGHFPFSSRCIPSVTVITSVTVRSIDIVWILAEVLSRVLWTNKQGDCCLYSPHDGSRDGALMSFGSMSMGCASLWLHIVLILMQPGVLLYHNTDNSQQINLSTRQSILKRRIICEQNQTRTTTCENATNKAPLT